MKALREKRKDSEQKSHTAPPLFLLTTAILGHSHNYKYRGMQAENCSCRRKSDAVGSFYLDMEFTNGNYYLTVILEIAVVAEESGSTTRCQSRCSC